MAGWWVFWQKLIQTQGDTARKYVRSGMRPASLVYYYLVKFITTNNIADRCAVVSAASLRLYFAFVVQNTVLTPTNFLTR